MEKYEISESIVGIYKCINSIDMNKYPEIHQALREITTLLECIYLGGDYEP